MHYKIFAIIVTYNPSYEVLLEQYNASKNQVSGLIYVDNASSGFSFPKEIIDKCTIIFNKENSGLAMAQNQGIRKAIEFGATHVLLLDDDSTPYPDMVINLASCEQTMIQSGHNVGLIGARIKDLYSPTQELADGIVFSGIRIKHIPITNRPESVSYCIASGSLIPIKVFENVGFINEKMFIDALDVEWCLRARHKGYEIFISPDAILKHRLGNGLKDRITSHSPMREYYIIRNNIYLLKLKHVPTGYRIRKLIMCILRILSTTIKGQFKYSQKACKGILDGIKM